MKQKPTDLQKYHERVNNNAYTNKMVQLVFKTAADMIKQLDENTYNELNKKYDLEKLSVVLRIRIRISKYKNRTQMALSSSLTDISSLKIAVSTQYGQDFLMIRSIGAAHAAWRIRHRL